MTELLAMPEPAEVTDPRPELTWIVGSRRPDTLQSACQSRAAASRNALERGKDLLWDPGRVATDRSAAAEYAGIPIDSYWCYWWQVRTWDAEGRRSAWSTPQRFRTGALRRGPAEGEARITTPCYPLARTEVVPVSVTALGPGPSVPDFGCVAFGALRLTVESRAGGETVTVRLGEARDAEGRVHRKPGGSIRRHQAEILLQPGRREYAVAFPARDGRRMPPEIGPWIPFRWAEVEGSPAPRRPAVAPLSPAGCRWSASPAPGHRRRPGRRTGREAWLRFPIRGGDGDATLPAAR